MKKIILVIFIIFFISGCMEEYAGGSQPQSLESILKSNTVWPHKVRGILDIVEAGGYQDSEYPTWAVGSLVTNKDELGVSIEVNGNSLKDAMIDIDSGKEVTVWLAVPQAQYGVLTYPVVKISAN